MYRNTVAPWPSGHALIVSLTLDKVALVDDTPQVHEMLKNYRWHAYYSTPEHYYMARWNNENKIRVMFQRELLGREAIGLCVVHKDGNSLNCQRDNLAVLPQMTVLRSKNSKFDDARRATIEVMSRGFYVRWLDEHRIIRLKTFSRRRFSTDEIAYSRALEFARSITPTRNTSTNLSIKSLLN